jgi:hypothetical protein
MSGLCFTVWKRGRQIRRIEKRFEQYLYEQENQKAEGQEGETEEGRDDSGGTS